MVFWSYFHTDVYSFDDMQHNDVMSVDNFTVNVNGNERLLTTFEWFDVDFLFRTNSLLPISLRLLHNFLILSISGSSKWFITALILTNKQCVKHPLAGRSSHQVWLVWNHFDLNI